MLIQASGIAKREPSFPPNPPEKKQEHTFKLHEIGPFGRIKIIKIVATRSHFFKS